MRRREPEVIAAARVLDLVDARAQVREHERRVRPRQEPTEIEDANAFERHFV
jgi:hypothetical protein